MSSERLWLKSKYMYAWTVGSVVVSLYMPMITGISCNEAMDVSFGFCCRRGDLIALIVRRMGVRRGKFW